MAAFNKRSLDVNLRSLMSEKYMIQQKEETLLWTRLKREHILLCVTVNNENNKSWPFYNYVL